MRQMALFSLNPGEHPLIAGGGFFLMTVGVVLVVAESTPRYRGRWLMMGFILGGWMAALGAGVGGPYGLPTRLQVASLVIAIVVEMATITWVLKRFPAMPARDRTLVILLIVALHFFIMVPAFGGSIALLGLLCLGNVAWAHGRPGYHITAVARVDGVLKAAVGLWMVSLALRG
jgi:hypothetical protein